MTNITVLVRRWHDGSNTYQSMRILVDGKEVDVIPFRYGYDHGETLLRESLIANYERYGLPKFTEYDSLVDYKVYDKITITWDVVNVSRRKHLHNGGK